LGYSENWINQRLKIIEIRKELTDAMPEKVCQQVNPIPSSSYPTPAKRPLWSVMQRVIPV
jgi:dTDP-4-dehydrorhamnose reductase